MSEMISQGDVEEYEIRRFKAGDREEYLDLYETVFGNCPSESWFDWKFAQNPYIDHVPIILAEYDKQIIGARSFLALSLQAEDEQVTAFQACDTMVHPEHQRKGLFTRMTELAISHYEPRKPALSFNFPNQKTLAGNQKLGWKHVQNVPVYYRYQNLKPYLDTVPDVLGRALSASLQGYQSLREYLCAPQNEKITITRYNTVPAPQLAALARRNRPDRFHIRRSKQFYDWRYSRPDRTYLTYVASRDEKPVAATIIGSGGSTEARFMEFLPRTGRKSAITARLIRTALREHANAPLITTLAGDISPGVLSAFGFHASTSWPLRWLVGTRPFVVRPFSTSDERQWQLEGTNIREADNWLLSFGELDVG